MRISDWSSDVCSSDLRKGQRFVPELAVDEARIEAASRCDPRRHHRELERIDADIALSDDRVERVRGGPSLVVFPHLPRDRKRVVSGQSVSVRVDLGGRRIIKKKK